MSLTTEQQTIIDHVTTTKGLTKVSAVAGSGKTFLLTKLAEALKPENGLYIAYTRAVANEAVPKFPSSVSCMTTHSLALRALRDLGYKLQIEGNLTYRLLPNKIPYEIRCDIIKAIDHFCLSEYLDFPKFAEANTELLPGAIKIGDQLLGAMSEGKAPCSHGFYLKLYHIALADKDIEYEPFDYLALDEAGDINLVTLEIFKLLPATRKVMVGDPHQNIFVFNRTVNCFELMKDEGTSFALTKSFRVSDKIASKIQGFCTTYLHEDMKFVGVPVDDTEIESEAYIARTNASLIAKMLYLNSINVPYSLTRSPDDMFRVLKMLCLSKPGSYISVPGYTHLQQDIEDWSKSPQLKKTYKSHLAYLKMIYNDDKTLSTSLSMIFNYGTKTVLDCYNQAKKYKSSKTTHHLTLGTAHSTKG